MEKKPNFVSFQGPIFVGSKCQRNLYKKNYIYLSSTRGPISFENEFVLKFNSPFLLADLFLVGG